MAQWSSIALPRRGSRVRISFSAPFFYQKPNRKSTQVGQRGRTVNPLAKLSLVRIQSLPPICGCSSVVEPQPSKLVARVRFPSPAPENSVALAQLDRASGYGPEGRGFESSKLHHLKQAYACFFYFQKTSK